MRLDEAIKSGKPFRRPNHDKWWVVSEKGILVEDTDLPLRSKLCLLADSVLADDWKIKKEPLEIWMSFDNDMFSLRGWDTKPQPGYRRFREVIE